MLNQFFDKVVCLTTSRWDACSKELSKYGIKAEKFKSVPHNDPKKSFNMSQRKLMRYLWEEGVANALVLEDDVMFLNMETLPNILDDLSRWEWDICYFGGNYDCHPNVKKATPVSKNLRRIYNAWTTHAVAYQRDAIEHITKNYRADVIYDAWLDENVLGDMYTVATVPLIAIQKPGYADLWQRDVDYSDVWQRSLDFIK